MAKAWTCIEFPQRHGSFLQDGIEKLQATFTDFQRGFGPLNPPHRRSVRHDRFACPQCASEGKPGWVRPADQTEVARMAMKEGT